MKQSFVRAVGAFTAVVLMSAVGGTFVFGLDRFLLEKIQAVVTAPAPVQRETAVGQ